MAKYIPTVKSLLLVDFDVLSEMPDQFNEADKGACQEIDALENLLEGDLIYLDFFKEHFPILAAEFIDIENTECDSILFVSL